MTGERQGLWGAIDEALFGHGSAVAMGVFRIVLGALALVDLALLAIDFQSWYTERGLLPLAALRMWIGPLDRHFTVGSTVGELPFTVPRISLFSGIADPRVMLVCFALVMVAALFTMLGLWTRVSSILLAVGIVSLHHRNPVILDGGDSVLRIGALYVALAPSGAACSLDRLIGLWRGRLSPGPVIVSLWPQRLVQINVALIYFTTVWAKWGGNLWRNGTATYYTARLNEFHRFWAPPFLRDFPAVYVTTYGTLAVELSLATLVFAKPCRKWVLLAGIVMHGYIEWTMNVPMFSFLMCALYLVFYSGEEMTDWAKRLGARFARFRRTVGYPAGARLRPGPRAALMAADPLGIIDLEEGSAPRWSPGAALTYGLRNVGLAPLLPFWGKLAKAAVEDS